MPDSDPRLQPSLAQMIRYSVCIPTRCTAAPVKALGPPTREVISSLNFPDSNRYHRVHRLLHQASISKWRDMIHQAWNVDPLQCPVCGAVKSPRLSTEHVSSLCHQRMFKRAGVGIQHRSGQAQFATGRTPASYSGKHVAEDSFGF